LNKNKKLEKENLEFKKQIESDKLILDKYLGVLFGKEAKEISAQE
jgi:hypothetical protein